MRLAVVILLAAVAGCATAPKHFAADLPPLPPGLSPSSSPPAVPVRSRPLVASAASLVTVFDQVEISSTVYPVQLYASKNLIKWTYNGTITNAWRTSVESPTFFRGVYYPPVPLSWNPSPSANVAGYLFTDGFSTNRYDVGAVTNASLPGLVTNLFTATAYYTNGTESVPSNTVNWAPPSTDFTLTIRRIP